MQGKRTNMTLRYEETGEVRPPRAGEWFRKSSGGVERARFDFAATQFPILREKLEPAADSERSRP